MKVVGTCSGLVMRIFEGYLGKRGVRRLPKFNHHLV